MGEVKDFNVFKKKKEDEAGEERTRKQSEEEEKQEAIDSIISNQFFLVRNILKNNPVNKHSDSYKNAFLELSKRPKKEVAEIINNAYQIDVEMRPARYAAALDILL